jgi:hypothetical protein
MHVSGRGINQRFLNIFQICGQEAVIEQEIPWLVTEGLDIDFWTYHKGFERTNRMDPADETPHPFKNLPAIKLGRTS